MEDIEYLPDRNLNKDTIAKLSTCTYIEEYRDVGIVGATDAGKTYIGCALDNAACRKFVRVKYVRLPELLVELSIARGNGMFRKDMDQYLKYGLLILDEWLLMQLDANAALDMFEIVEARYKCLDDIHLAVCASWLAFPDWGWKSRRCGEGQNSQQLL